MKTMKTLLSVSMDGSVFCVRSLCLKKNQKRDLTTISENDII